MKVKLMALVLGALLALGIVGNALADAKAPTNGGLGAGHSGQCTGNPDD